MIIRLSTIQVSEHWNAIKDMLEKAVVELPGQLLNTDNNMLRSLLIGESVCWIGYKHVAEKRNDIICMLITRILCDNITGIKSILIYCLNGWEVIDNKIYRDGLETLKRYGKENDCHRIIFYSKESRILQITEAVGFDLSLRFGVLRLKNERSLLE